MNTNLVRDVLECDLSKIPFEFMNQQQEEEDDQLRFSDVEEDELKFDEEEEEKGETKKKPQRAAEEEESKYIEYMDLAMKPIIEKRVKKILESVTFSATANDIRQELSSLRDHLGKMQRKSKKKWDAFKKEGAEVYNNVREANQKFFSTTKECFDDIENELKQSETNMMQLINSLSQRLDKTCEKLEKLEKTHLKNPTSDMITQLDQVSSVNLKGRFLVDNNGSTKEFEQISEIMRKQEKFEEMLHQMKTEQQMILAAIKKQEQEKHPEEERISFVQTSPDLSMQSSVDASVISNDIDVDEQKEASSISKQTKQVDSTLPQYMNDQEKNSTSLPNNTNTLLVSEEQVTKKARGPSEEKKKRKFISTNKNSNKQEEEEDDDEINTVQEEDDEIYSQPTKRKQSKNKVDDQKESQMGQEQKEEKSSKNIISVDQTLLDLINSTIDCSKSSKNLNLPDHFTLLVSKLKAAFKGQIKVNSCQVYISKYLRSIGYSVSTTNKNRLKTITATKKQTKKK